MNQSISGLLQVALAEKQLSITAAAHQAKVERVFLNRLVRGEAPPRLRDGNLGADEDARYRRIAITLGIEPAIFLERVKEEQPAGPQRDRWPTREEMDAFANEVWAEFGRRQGNSQEGFLVSFADWLSVFRRARNRDRFQAWLSDLAESYKGFSPPPTKTVPFEKKSFQLMTGGPGGDATVAMRAALGKELAVVVNTIAAKRGIPLMVSSKLSLAFFLIQAQKVETPAGILAEEGAPKSKSGADDSE